jgi:hypothetical protein
MKIGYVHAMAVVLLGGSATLAQAPLPVGYDDPMGRSATVVPTAVEAPPPAPAVQATPFASIADHAPASCCDPALPSHVVDDLCPHIGGRFYGSAEYLLWHIRGQPVPSVVNNIPVGVLTITTADSNQNPSGNLIATGLNPVIHFFPVTIASDATGPGRLDDNDHNGARFTVGVWSDPEHCMGFEVSGFDSARQSSNFVNLQNNANNQFIVTTPFTNNVYTVTPNPDGTTTRTLFETFPVFFVRQANLALLATGGTQMWGAELNARCNGCYYGPVAVGAIAGLRYLNFQDDLTVDDNFTLVRPAGLPSQGGVNGDPPTGGGRPFQSPLIFNTFDHATTRNNFIGGQIGVDFDADIYGFTFDLRGKVAMGAMYEIADIVAFTSNNDQVAGGFMPGGLLYGQADNGRHTRTKIAFIPELNFKVGYHFTENLVGFVGYDVMYLSQVIRPGDLSSSVRSSTSANVGGTPIQLSTSSQVFQFNDSHTWAQGFNFGMQVSF